MLSSSKLYIFNLIVKILPPSHCNKFKVTLLRWAGAKVGKNVVLFTPKILGNFELIIGDNVWIGHEPLISGPSGSTIRIDDYAKIGSRVVIVSGYHDYSPKYNSVAGPGKYADVHLCKGCGISSLSMICPGKTIGEKAHVAAGSVVTRDVPPYTRVAGVPARVIKNFKEDSE